MLVVIGGGRFGSYHARQLLKAVRSGRLAGERLLVVDRSPACPAFDEFKHAPEVSFAWSDWARYLDSWLCTAASSDHLVPAPLAPHLLWEWLASELGAARVAPPRGWGLPYEVPGPGLELFISAAAWTCPATCVEPAHCPALHGPRDWDLADLIRERAAQLGHRQAVFQCLHLAEGIGSIRVGEVLAARERLAGPGKEPILVATSSRCHAAVGALAPLAVGYTLRLAKGA
jgi:hypothetical protein